MGGQYGKVLAEVFCTDKAIKGQGLCDKNQRQYFPVQNKQTRLIREVLYDFVESQFFHFFQTANQPISMHHLSQPYNKQSCFLDWSNYRISGQLIKAFFTSALAYVATSLFKWLHGFVATSLFKWLHGYITNQMATWLHN